MKSPMIEKANYIERKAGYTELMVCQSGAGYYVGTMFNECDETGKFLFQEPGSRDSDYYATGAEAEALLKQLASMDDDDAALCLRQYP